MAETGALLNRANLLLAQGRPKDAEKQLNDLLKEDPENDYALSLLGRCKFDLHLFKEGISIVQQAIRINPHEGYYFYLLAFGYYRIDANETAQKCLQKAVELNPYAPDFFGLWSLILIEEKNFKVALEKANEGLAVDAENITCLNARSTALNKLKRVDDAIATMQDALEKDPENDFTHTTVGWNLLEKGRYKEATEHFKEALRINPNLPGAKAGLKEALKSKIPPYKWLLQYSFWINNKGKKARWVFPLALFAIVRFIDLSSLNASREWKIAGGAIIALYLLFVATTWIINPLANFFLLFDKNGKYALANSERWSAILMISALLPGIAIILLSLGMEEQQGTNLLFVGILILSLALPLGHMKYPIRLKGNNLIQWYSMALVAAALIFTVLIFIFTPIRENLLIAYAVGFVGYSWASLFSSK
jgi:tetratricopeptide (TPR) repeat protein